MLEVEWIYREGKEMNSKQLEIYIHIPFCVRKCDYCDFLSMSMDEGTKREYVNALVREIELSKEKMEGRVITSVFIGGGTPSILQENFITKIMEAVKNNCHLSDDAEITIECNPGTVTEAKLNSYKEAGINRISFGLQSANDQELKSIGRIHDFAKFKESYELARKVGFENINVDVMSALPGQTVESYKHTLESVLAMESEHISAYSLIVEDGTPLQERVQEAESKNINILPDEDAEREMYYLTEKMLEENGYVHYEISNYGKPGFQCRHNIGYWKRVDYLGFGLGAASLYNDSRYSNTEDIDKYISLLLDGKDTDSDFYGDSFIYQDDIWDITEDAISVIEGKIQHLTEKDKKEEFMFLGLRMIEGISKEEFHQAFDRKYDSVYGEVTEKLVQQGLIEVNGDNVRLTKKGVDLSNYAMSQFLL